MQAITYSIRYENQIVETDTVDLYGQIPRKQSNRQLLREQLACELAAGYLASEVFESEDGNTEFLGEPIATRIGKGIWEVQFWTPFCPEPESVVIRFF